MLDIEGAEYKVLNTIDFKHIKINEIFFEKKHFDGFIKQGEKFNLIKSKLETNNYILKDIDDENILATLKRPT